MAKKIKRDTLPSEKPAIELDARTAERQRTEAVIAMMREDFGRTFQTDHGKRVLAWLAQRCGWGKPPLAASQDGKINAEYTVHNAMELSLYLKIREFIAIPVLQEVEYGFIKPTGTLTSNEKGK